MTCWRKGMRRGGPGTPKKAGVRVGGLLNSNALAGTKNMSIKTVTGLKKVSKNLRGLVEGALQDSDGLLRLAPCWVPRSFLQPGKRLKLAQEDLYAYGLNRGGIDERW